MKTTFHRNHLERAIGLFGAVIVTCLVCIWVATLAVVIYRAIQRILPHRRDPIAQEEQQERMSNAVARVYAEAVAQYGAEAGVVVRAVGVVQVPVLVWPNQTPDMEVLVEWSTNLVDWQTAGRLLGSDDFTWTNAALPAVFFRQRLESGELVTINTNLPLRRSTIGAPTT